jgi:hypothetical protein
VGALTLSGDLDLVNGPVAIRARGPLSPARLAALGAEGLDGNGVVDATITTDLRAKELSVAADGVVEYAPFVYPNVTIAELIAPFSATVQGGKTRGTVNLRGGRFDALGLTGSTLDGNRVRFEVDKDAIRVSGPIALRQVDYDGYLSSAVADADFTFTTRGTHRAVDATVALGGWTLAGRPGGDGTVGVQLRDDALAYTVALRDDAGGAPRPVLDTGGSFDLQTEQVVLNTLRWAPTPRATWAADRPVTLALTDGGVRDADLAVTSPLGHVELRGRIGTEGPLDATIQTRGLQLDTVAELYPDRFDGLSGALDLDLALSGDAAAPTAHGDVDLRGLFVPDQVRWLDVKGPVDLIGGELRPEVALAVAGTPLGQLTGHVPTKGGLADVSPDRDGQVDLDLQLVPGDFARLAHLAPSLDGSALPVGRFSADLQAHDVLADPVLHLAGVAEVEVQEWQRPARVELDLTRRASELVVDADLREGLQTRATLAGTAATRLGEAFAYLLPAPGATPAAPDWSDPELYLDRIDASAALVGVPVDRLAAMAGAPVELSGEVVGGIGVTGSPMRPVLDGAVNWLDPKVGDQPLEGAYLALVPAEDGGYTLDADVRFPAGGPKRPGGSLTVSGQVPVALDFDRPTSEWSRGDLALDVAGEGVPLAVLSGLVPDVRSAAGQLLVQGTIGGPVSAPRPDLVAKIEGGQVGYTPLGVIAGDLELEARVAHQQIDLVRADFTLTPNRRFQPLGLVSEATSFVEGSGEPRVAMSGSVQLDDQGHPGPVEGKVVLTNGAWLASTEDDTLRASGELTLGGTWPKVAVGGDLSVVYGQVSIDTAQLASGTPLELDPSLVVVRPGVVALPPREPAGPPFYSDFDVNVNVDLKRNLELAMTVPFLKDFGDIGAQLSRADVAARLGGQVRVRMQGGEPALVGAVDVVDGSVRLLRSTLELDEGSITFAGGDPYLNTSLDLHGSMTVTGGDLTVAITGSPADPVFTPSSQAYPDRTQQLAILLTGRAPDELTSDQGSAAVETVTSTVLSTLLSGRSVGTLTIAPDNSVRFGIPVSSSIYATSFFNPTQTDPEQNTLALQLEWSPARWFVLSGGVGDRVGWGDVFWEVRF